MDLQSENASAEEQGISLEEMISQFEAVHGTAHMVEANKLVADKLYPELADNPNLAVLRLRAGLSQRALADKMGVKQPHVARLERNPTKMTYETMERLAHALMVDVTAVAAAIRNTQAETQHV